MRFLRKEKKTSKIIEPIQSLLPFAGRGEAEEARNGR